MMEAVDITKLSFNILADDGMSNEDLYCSMWYLAYITLILKLSTARIAKKYRFLICVCRIFAQYKFCILGNYSHSVHSRRILALIFKNLNKHSSPKLCTYLSIYEGMECF